MRVGAIFPAVNTLTGLHYQRSGVFLGQAHRLVGAGVEHIELTGDHFNAEPWPRDYLRREIDLLLPFKKSGITFSLHAPCMAGISLGSHHERVRRASVEAILESYALIEMLEPTAVVMHPNTLAEIDRELHPPTRLVKNYLIGLARENTRRSLEELAQTIPVEKLFLENIHYGDLADYRGLIEQSGCGVCYDIGHNYLRHPGLAACERFFAAWRNLIRHIHLSNVCVYQSPLPYGLTRLIDHQPITDPNGLIHTEIFCRMFRFLGYKGPVILEEYYNSNIAMSVKLLRSILDAIRREEKHLPT